MKNLKNKRAKSVIPVTSVEDAESWRNHLDKIEDLFVDLLLNNDIPFYYKGDVLYPAFGFGILTPYLLHQAVTEIMGAEPDFEDLRLIKKEIMCFPIIDGMAETDIF
ncbi:MAG TPA: hypothetical protein VD794_13390 [Flavisolibacter sp.]|nr:hypothetical protein [Flavisolibacter sp.]